MIGDFWATVFSRYIDKVLKLKKDPGSETFSKSHDQGLKSVVKTLARIDFSSSSAIKDSLKQNLLERMRKKESGELDDQQLDNVAGGLSRTYEMPDDDGKGKGE